MENAADMASPGPSTDIWDRNRTAWLQADPQTFQRVERLSPSALKKVPTLPSCPATLGPASFRGANRTLVYGIGDGRVVNTCLQADRQVLVIEPDTRQLRRVLSRYDWSNDFGQRLRILIPRFTSPEFLEISLLECVIDLQQWLRDSKVPFEVMDLGWSEFRQVLKEIQRAAGIPAEIERRVQGWPISTEPCPEITVVSPRCQIFDDLAACFSEIGTRVRLLEIPDKPREWSRTRWLHALRTLRDGPNSWILQRNRCWLDPDNPRERMDLSRFLPGKLVSWWWDVPNVTTYLEYQLGLHAEPKPALHETPGYAFARGLLPLLPSGSAWLPPAARTVFGTTDLAGLKNAPAQRKIVFVGQSRFDTLRANLNALVNILAESRRDLAACLADAINRAPTMIELHAALELSQREIGDTIRDLCAGMPAHGYYLNYLAEMCRSAAYRLAAITSLAAFPLMVFGDEGWLRSNAVTPDKFGGLLGPSQLPALYAQDHLHLNLNFMQVSTTVNPRVLDIAAAGGAVLTDDRPELAELFPSQTARPFSFQSLEALPDLIATLLKADLRDHRLSIATHVRAQHMMMHRATRLAQDLDLTIAPR